MSALRVGGALRFADGSVLEFRRRKGRSATVIDADDPRDFRRAAARRARRRESAHVRDGIRPDFAGSAGGGRALLAAGGGLAETLAASSAGLNALLKLRETLSADADALFTPRKSAGKGVLRRARRLRRSLTRTARRHRHRRRAESGGSKAADALNEQQRRREDYEEAGRILATRERASRTHAGLARLAALARELQAFADCPRSTPPRSPSPGRRSTTIAPCRWN